MRTPGHPRARTVFPPCNRTVPRRGRLAIGIDCRLKGSSTKPEVESRNRICSRYSLIVNGATVGRQYRVRMRVRVCVLVSPPPVSSVLCVDVYM